MDINNSQSQHKNTHNLNNKITKKINNNNIIKENINNKLETNENLPEDIVMGELRKLKTNGITLFSNTNLRWVELDFKRKIFGYKINRNDQCLKEYHNLYDFVNYNPETSQEHKKKSKWNFSFYLNFKSKNYTFYAESKAEYTKWKNAFTRVRNVFINFKDLSLSVFEVALEKFAKPFYHELEKQRLSETENEKHTLSELLVKAAEPKPELVPLVKSKVNYALLLGAQKNVEKLLSSDIYGEEIKNVVEKEIENLEINKKMVQHQNLAVMKKSLFLYYIIKTVFLFVNL